MLYFQLNINSVVNTKCYSTYKKITKLCHKI